MRIGIDLMGGDTPPTHLFEGVYSAAAELEPSHTLVLYATPNVIGKIAPRCQKNSRSAQIECVPCPDVIEMEEEPVASVKRKPQASLVVGLEALANRTIDGFVSCGNTGALVAAAVLHLNKFPKVLRPALVATLPSEKGPVVVIDVGGSTTSKARHLIQFALLGSVYQQAIYQVQRPRVGLLNIGVESKKGREEIQAAYHQLEALSHQENRIIFAGNVEGRDIFKGDVDVIVTDGFTGNVLLKTAEGTAAFVFDVLKANRPSDPTTATLGKQLCDEQQCGALLCGVDRLVMKVHGNATPQTLHRALLKAAACIQSDCISQMASLYTR